MNIRKVAEMAGVSVATISRVLNHPEQVLPETREHVLAVMKEQNYTPNWFARGLNLGTTHTISLLIPNIESETNQRIISGIETIARSKGYAVFFCNTHGDRAIEEESLSMCENRRVDGVVLVSLHLPEERVQQARDNGIPAKIAPAGVTRFAILTLRKARIASRATCFRSGTRRSNCCSTRRKSTKARRSSPVF
jgi:LacI family transcriptional regulator